jgi:hypothetical protein
MPRPSMVTTAEYAPPFSDVAWGTHVSLFPVASQLLDVPTWTRWRTRGPWLNDRYGYHCPRRQRINEVCDEVPQRVFDCLVLPFPNRGP